MNRKVSVTVAMGTDLPDALGQLGPQADCAECSLTVAAPYWVSDDVWRRVVETFAPNATQVSRVKTRTGAGAALKFPGNHWITLDVDRRADRLHKIRMPAGLVQAQRLLVVNDLRPLEAGRPDIAIGLWALYAHPFQRFGARLGGAREGLTAELALAVRPDCYILIDRLIGSEAVLVVVTSDIVAAELTVLGLRQNEPGPWEDPLVQRATELQLGVSQPSQLDLIVLTSPALLSDESRPINEVSRTIQDRLGMHDYSSAER